MNMSLPPIHSQPSGPLKKKRHDKGGLPVKQVQASGKRAKVGAEEVQSGGSPALVPAVATIGAASVRRADSKGSLMQGAQDAGAPSQQMIDALGQGCARELLSCVSGNHIRLDLLGAATFLKLVNLASPACESVWRSIGDLAARQGSIVTLPALPEGASDLSKCGTLCTGLSQLSGVEQVTFTMPERTGSMDLNVGALQIDTLKKIELRAPDAAGQAEPDQVQATCIRVTVPDGVWPQASGFPRSIHKCTAAFVSREGAPVGKLRALPGIIYFRQPTDFLSQDVDSKDSGRTEAGAARTAAERNLNIAAEFAVQPPAGLDQDNLPDEYLKKVGQSGDPIRCQHLSIHWAQKRLQYHQKKASADSKSPAGRYSQPELTSLDRIYKLDQKQIEQNREELLKRGNMLPDTGFDFENFGGAIARRFDGMKANEARLYVCGTTNHSMAVELQVKETTLGTRKHQEYVVTFYDPNRTGTHLRLVVNDPKELQGRHLADWIGHNGAAQYSVSKQSMTPDTRGSLYPWPPVDVGAVAARPVHAMVGKQVEPRGDDLLSIDPASIKKCRDGNLRAIRGGDLENVLCVADHYSIGCLKQFQKYPDQLVNAGVPKSDIEAALAERAGSFYLVPAQLLRESPSP